MHALYFPGRHPRITHAHSALGRAPTLKLAAAGARATALLTNVQASNLPDTNLTPDGGMLIYVELIHGG